MIERSRMNAKENKVCSCIIVTPPQEKISTEYPIAFKDNQLKQSVNTLLKTFDLVPMNAYDHHDRVIPPNQLLKKLKGVFFQVVFTLHYTVTLLFSKTNQTLFEGRL